MADLKGLNLDKVLGESTSGAPSGSGTEDLLITNPDPFVKFTKPEKKIEGDIEDKTKTPENKALEKKETNDTLGKKLEDTDKTKPEVKSEESNEITVVDQIIEDSGVELSEEERKNIANDIPGILKLNKLIATKIAESQLDDFFDEYPEVYDFALHIKAGGKPEDFISNGTTSYSGVKIDENNTEQHKDIYTKSLVKKGYTPPDAKDLVELAETKGILKEKAVGGLADLQADEVKAKADKEAKIEMANKKDATDRLELATKINSIIDSGKINGVDIPKAEQLVLKEFYSKKNKEGILLRTAAYNSITLEQQILLDRIVQSGFKGLGTSITSTKQTLDSLGKDNKDRKDRLNGTSRTNGGDDEKPAVKTVSKDTMKRLLEPELGIN